MSEFFRRSDQAGLALFLNAGDPPLPVLADVVRMLDESKVDCLELAVPFPGSVTDGPTVRRSADRALADGVELDDVLKFVESIRGELKTLRIALLADWSHTVRRMRHNEFVRRTASSGVDGLLVHGLPPRLREEHLRTAADAGMPVVTTCYASSAPETQIRAAEDATAYLYLVTAYGRSGSRPADGYARLSGVIAELRRHTTAPIAAGFGVRTRSDICAITEAGADAAVVGSVAVAAVAQALDAGQDVVNALAEVVGDLHLGVQEART